MSTSLHLSKSQFVRGIICAKSLYLHKYRHPKDEKTTQDQSTLDAGTRLGRYAQEAFPGGIEVPFDGLSIPEQLDMTTREIAAGREVIYEAAFQYDDVFVKADIIRKTGDAWELYEVKASNGVKDYYLHDAAVQYYVLTGSGLKVGKVAIMHLNREYVRCGEIDRTQLFAMTDITEEIQARQGFVREQLMRQRHMLAGPMPAVAIGPQCEDPYRCDYYGTCWQDVGENEIESVFQLRGRGVDPYALYRQGIARMADIPLDLLNDKQLFQLQSTLQKKDQTNLDGIREFLQSLWYPLCHLDFETFMSAIPPFDGTGPYQQIPFQFSLHVQLEAGGPISHHEYLAQPDGDPRPALLTQLQKHIPPGACVLTYNKSFEITRLKEMARDVPQYRPWVEATVPAVRDLMQPFARRDCYRWQMNGSASIKKVLPAMIPGFGYGDLEIADGGAAMEAYHRMVAAVGTPEYDTIRHNLLLYCKRDTEAMVRILEQLQSLTR